MIVTLEHLSTIPGFGPNPGLCRHGAREWCARNGIDWDTFRREGVDSEVLLATGDAYALALVEWAEKMEAERGRIQ